MLRFIRNFFLRLELRVLEAEIAEYNERHSVALEVRGEYWSDYQYAREQGFSIDPYERQLKAARVSIDKELDRITERCVRARAIQALLKG